jgi:HAE1 family hydrophobic/amphiphilic exporter-1
MIALAVMALGVVALTRLPVDLLPRLEYPRIAVETSFPLSSPEEVERLVTTPIEEEISTVRSLRRYRSVSTGDRSRIILEFDWGTSMDFVRLEVREKLDRARWELPGEAGRPTLVEFDPSRRPFMTIAFLREGDPIATADFAERLIVPRIEQVEGVGAIEVEGEREGAVFVRLEEEALSLLGLSAGTVSSALAQANLRLPGGVVSEGYREFYLGIDGEYKNFSDLSKVVVARRGSTPVLLGDVATLSIEPKPFRRVTRLDGTQCLLLRIQKMAGANTVSVAGEVTSLLDEMTGEFPGITLEVLESDAQFIEDALDGVREALIIGAALAFLVLFVFLREWRSPLLLGIAIPVSLLIAFFFIFITGMSVNVMTLSGLALGVGLLVDNAIVVLEAIHRSMDDGNEPKKAARLGTSEVALAIMASTFTTIIVFFPVIYVEGVAGQLFKAQALSVTFALLASLVVATTVLPALAARVHKRGGEKKDILERFRRIYLRMLSYSLGKSRIILCGTVLLFFVTAYSALYLPRSLLPHVSSNAVDVKVRFSAGTPFEELDGTVQRIEKRILGTPVVKRVVSRIGLRGEEEGVDALLVAFGHGSRHFFDSIPARELWGQMEADISWTYRSTLLGEILTTGAPNISVLVTGRNTEYLRSAAEDIAGRLHELDDISNLAVKWLPGTPEITCRVDLDMAHLAGITPREVSEAMQASARGLVATEYHKEDDRIDVLLFSDQGEGIPWRNLLDETVVTAHGEIPLRNLIYWNERSLPGQIEHDNGEKVVRIDIFTDSPNIGSIAAAIQEVLDGYETGQTDWRANLGPEVEEMNRSLQSLILAGLLAIGLVYALLTGQFESFALPLVIMGTVPLGLIGVTIALFVTGAGWNIMTGIGVVILSGIVVNDGILLVDRIRQARRAGKERRQAVIEAGEMRFRPVVMTTVTTVLGLLPMALGFGTGAELRKGLAIAVIGGIIVATFLTLFVIPMLYVTATRSKAR